MATMDFQIRTALKLMDQYDTVDRGELSLKGVGEKTISVLLESGWATLSHSMSGIKRYSITPSGREKAKEPPPPKPPKRKPLKMIEPRLKTLSPRLGSPKRK